MIELLLCLAFCVLVLCFNCCLPVFWFTCDLVFVSMLLAGVGGLWVVLFRLVGVDLLFDLVTLIVCVRLCLFWLFIFVCWFSCGFAYYLCVLDILLDCGVLERGCWWFDLGCLCMFAVVVVGCCLMICWWLGPVVWLFIWFG